MKKINHMFVGVVAISLATVAFAADSEKAVVKSYKTCNVAALAKQLASSDNAAKRSFRVNYIADTVANYNYYLIVDRGAFNADKIRTATCSFINKNQCQLWWGNVVSMGMIADQKAAWFPADTSPHYKLSPKITCNEAKWQ